MAAVDYFLKLEGIQGESPDDKHKNEKNNCGKMKESFPGFWNGYGTMWRIPSFANLDIRKHYPMTPSGQMCGGVQPASSRICQSTQLVIIDLRAKVVRSWIESFRIIPQRLKA